MPDDVEQIKIIRSQALSVLAEVTATPKPSYSVDGQSIAWADYLEQLRRTVAWCDERLAAAEPFELRSIAGTGA